MILSPRTIRMIFLWGRESVPLRRKPSLDLAEMWQRHREHKRGNSRPVHQPSDSSVVGNTNMEEDRLNVSALLR